MFGLFKKKETVEVKPQKPKKVFSFADEDFNIGSTEVFVTFKDGKKFTTKVYGYVHQRQDGGYKGTPNWVDAKAGTPEVTSSVEIAERYISNINSSNVSTVTDDPKKPRKSHSDYIVSASMGKTFVYLYTYPVASVVESKEVIL